MTNENPIVGILRELINVLYAYENKNNIFSNQGQALDGYSALANLLSIANKAKDLLENQEDLDVEFKQILYEEKEKYK